MNTVLRFLIGFAIVSLTSCEKEPFLELGMEYQGGKIFYLDKTGKHGLIAAPKDISVLVRWGCESRVIPGTNFTYLGTGLRNTERIVDFCDQPTAASFCADLKVNNFEDWYLPAKDELILMYENREHIGNMRNGVWEPYWSSSQYELQNRAFVHNFGTGQTTIEDKSLGYWVRPIRSF